MHPPRLGRSMDILEFEWDPSKASSNARKHGVTFAEASSVFGDALARVLRATCVGQEARDVIIGFSSAGKLLVVVFVERDRIRIVSARRATPLERHAYQEARG